MPSTQMTTTPSDRCEPAWTHATRRLTPSPPFPLLLEPLSACPQAHVGHILPPFDHLYQPLIGDTHTRYLQTFSLSPSEVKHRGSENQRPTGLQQGHWFPQPNAPIATEASQLAHPYPQPIPIHPTPPPPSQNAVRRRAHTAPSPTPTLYPEGGLSGISFQAGQLQRAAHPDARHPRSALSRANYQQAVQPSRSTASTDPGRRGDSNERLHPAQNFP